MSDVARILKEARDQGRLTALDFAKEIFDDFIELHGDRNFRDDGAVIGGIGRLNGQAVTVVGIQKGKNLQGRQRRLCPSLQPVRRDAAHRQGAETADEAVAVLPGGPGSALCEPPQQRPPVGGGVLHPSR